MGSARARLEASRVWRVIPLQCWWLCVLAQGPSAPTLRRAASERSAARALLPREEAAACPAVRVPADVTLGSQEEAAW